MAVEACSEGSTQATSPRISFSLDLRLTGADVFTQTIPSSSSPADPLLDLDFRFDSCITNEPSSAEELFSHGLIKPKQITRQISLPNPRNPVPNRARAGFENSKDEAPKEIPVEPKSKSNSFWRIKRSSSLHFETSSHRKSSFWPLPLLSRSHSTGSERYSKLQPTKDYQKQGSNKPSRLFTSASSSSSSSSSSSVSSYSKKPPLKKKNGVKYNGNGVRISPMLNVPPPIISTNLFGLGFLFSTGKEKKGRK